MTHSQLKISGTVSRGINRFDGGPEPLVRFDASPFVKRNPDSLESQPCNVRVPPDGHQHDRIGLYAGDASISHLAGKHSWTGSGFGHFDSHAFHDGDSFVCEDFLEHLSGFWLAAWKESGVVFAEQKKETKR